MQCRRRVTVQTPGRDPGTILINFEITLTPASFIQGYLSEYLHQEHGFKILALECDEQRVKSATDRQSKLFPKSKDHVKYISHFITEASMNFIKEQIATHFNLDIPYRVALVGLHACGDLSVTALKLATNELAVKALVIMPCCYHRMGTLTKEDKEFRNFPLSDTLRTIIRDRSDTETGAAPKGSVTAVPPLHRPFLRLACQQSVKHWQRMGEQEHRVHGNRMYTRSLVGALVSAPVNDDPSVGECGGGLRKARNYN